MKQKLPIKYSYKVTESFYGGEYPFEIMTRDGIAKLKCLIDFGVNTFIDLTDEPLNQYAKFLPETCVRIPFPTRDYTSPDFSILQKIHARIDEAEKLGEKIYVHCKGGHDRTGVVVATYFVHAGFSPSEAKQKFYEAFVPPVRGRYPHRPLIETEWKLLEQYQEWLRKNGKLTRKSESPKIRIVLRPDHFIEDINCPYCNKPTLGVIEVPVTPTKSRWTFGCLNEDCITQARVPASWEVDDMVREALDKE